MTASRPGAARRALLSAETARAERTLERMRAIYGARVTSALVIESAAWGDPQELADILRGREQDRIDALAEAEAEGTCDACGRPQGQPVHVAWRYLARRMTCDNCGSYPVVNGKCAHCGYNHE